MDDVNEMVDQPLPLVPAGRIVLPKMPLTPHGGHLCLRLTLPATERVVDFHHQVVAHAGRTKEGDRDGRICRPGLLFPCSAAAAEPPVILFPDKTL